MPLYFYKVKDQEGKTLQGTLAVNSQEQLLIRLWEKGYYILKINEIPCGRGKLSFLHQGKGLLFKKVSSRDLMFFCRQLSAMLSAGMNILNSFYILEREAENLLLREALGKVIKSMEQGNALAESLSKNPRVFPPLVIHMVEAGEAGGFLDLVTDRLGDHFQREHDFKEKIKSAVSYPALLLTFSFLVVFFLVVMVLPTFKDIFVGMGVDLPLFTRIMIGLGEGILLYGPFIASAILLSALIFIKKIKTPRGRIWWHTLLFKVPLYGKLYRKALLARLTRTLGTLYESGVGLLFSLELLENITGNTLLSRALYRTREAVRRGFDLATPLSESQLFPHVVVEMIRVGESTGQLNEMLIRSAQFLEGEVEYVVERLAVIIEPLLIIFMAFIVGGIALSILLPMFEIFQNIG